jgi:D-alanine-D-alanine ligase
LIGNAPPEPLPLHEIDFSRLPDQRPHIVSYQGKWNPRSIDFRGTRPVRAEGLDRATHARCVAAATAAFAALELRDYARIDLRLAADGTPYVIDVNPNCDLSAGAGVARAASYGGLAYSELIERVCTVALERARAQSESPHVHRDRPLPRGAVPASVTSPPAPAAPAVARSRRDRRAGAGGSAVHPGRGIGRARAGRRRDR